MNARCNQKPRRKEAAVGTCHACSPVPSTTMLQTIPATYARATTRVIARPPLATLLLAFTKNNAVVIPSMMNWKICTTMYEQNPGGESACMGHRFHDEIVTAGSLGIDNVNGQKAWQSGTPLARVVPAAMTSDPAAEAASPSLIERSMPPRPHASSACNSKDVMLPVIVTCKAC